MQDEGLPLRILQKSTAKLISHPVPSNRAHSQAHAPTHTVEGRAAMQMLASPIGNNLV